MPCKKEKKRNGRGRGIKDISSSRTAEINKAIQISSHCSVGESLRSGFEYVCGRRICACRSFVCGILGLLNCLLPFLIFSCYISLLSYFYFLFCLSLSHYAYCGYLFRSTHLSFFPSLSLFHSLHYLSLFHFSITFISIVSTSSSFSSSSTHTHN